MMLKILIVMLAATACTTEPFDPTGTWAMRLDWQAPDGDCNEDNTPSIFDVAVTQLPDNRLSITQRSRIFDGALEPDLEISDDSARLHGDVYDDFFNDGTAEARIAFDATANSDRLISGTGFLLVSGSASCRQDFVITGELEPE